MSTKPINKTSQIVIEVETNENNLPTEIKWSASDAGIEDNISKAFFLSVWDPKEENTMRIDLWTKDMNVDEMKKFFHQTLLSMADTFENATGEHLICEDLKDYCYHFAKKMQLIKE